MTLTHQETPVEPKSVLGHTEHQPAPVRLEGKPSVAVLPYVLQDFRDKAKVGLEKYGTRLRTNNGRDALADAYQEAVDKVMYLKQRLMEEDIEAGRDQLWRLDADLALDETWWTQQEELRQLKDRADFLEETHDLSEAKVAFYRSEAEKLREQLALSKHQTETLFQNLADAGRLQQEAYADFKTTLELLHAVVLDRYETEGVLDVLLSLHQKYGKETNL